MDRDVVMRFSEFAVGARCGSNDLRSLAGGGLPILCLTG